MSSGRRCFDYSLIRQEKNPAASLRSAARRSLRSRRWWLRPQTPDHFYAGRWYPRHQPQPQPQPQQQNHLVGKPLVFGQLSVELLALLPAPDRSGKPAPRNCFGPHPACPRGMSIPLRDCTPYCLFDFGSREQTITSETEFRSARYAVWEVTTPIPTSSSVRKENSFSSFL
jgi:hypothetical protein